MYKLVLSGLVLTLLFVGCSSNKGLVGNEAGAKLKPVKPLEMNAPESSVNLVVKAGNIADLSHSNKNRFELYVNGKLVKPSNKVDNATANYIYHLQLRPGYYDVKGIYYWNDGWREERTKVSTPDLVRVEDFRQTILEINIPKDWRGMVTEDDLFFKVSYKSLYEKKPQRIAEEPGSSPGEEVRPKVVLQINSDPDNCDVIIDDEMVGQTPITVWIDRNSSHVVQLKYPNYRTKMRLIDKEGLKHRDKLIMLERLEPLPYITNFNQPGNPPINVPQMPPGNNNGNESANNGDNGKSNTNNVASDTTNTTTAASDSTDNNDVQ